VKGRSGVRSPPQTAARFLAFFLAAGAAGLPHGHAAEKPYAPSSKIHLQRVAVDIQADGTSTTRYEYERTVLAEAALKSLSEQGISYHENNGTLDDVVAYTRKADGTKVEVPETNIQVTTHNGVNGAPPAFSDLKNRRLIYPSVEVGDTVVLAYTIRNEKPTFKGYFSLLTYYSPAYVYDAAELVVTAARSLDLKYKAHNLADPEVSDVDADRRRWKWTYQNASAEDPSKSSSLFERAWRYSDWPTIEISNFKDYDAIAAAYEAEAAPRAAVTDRIKALADEITKGTSSERERAEKIYKWVAKEISFAGNCLSGGDVVPRSTDLILNMKMGDCKDHATLVQALLAAQGIQSTQVLINAGRLGYELPEIPCWQAFNHVINYVPAFDVYLDATSSSSPFGVLPDQEAGKLVIHTRPYAGIKQTPPRAASAESSKSIDKVTVLADGSVDATASYQVTGTLAHEYSKRFTEWRKSQNFDGGEEYIKRQIEESGYKGSGLYVDIQETQGAEDKFSYAMRYRVDGYLDTENPYGVTLSAFFPNPAPIAGLVAYAAAEPYTHDFLCSGDSKTEELSITFPDNVKLLAIPRNVHAQTELVQYDARYERKGNTIHLLRSVVDKTPGPVCAAEVSSQYAQIAAAIKKDLKAQAVYQPK